MKVGGRREYLSHRIICSFLAFFQKIISKISIFEGTEVSFHKLLSKCIKPMFFLKGEYVVRKYDIGHEVSYTLVYYLRLINLK